MGLIGRLWQFANDALIPPRKTERAVRALTLDELLDIRRPHAAGTIEALLPYEDPRVAALIWELKYYASGRAAQMLGNLLGQEIHALVSEELSHMPLLIPVPLHPKREKARGYNQTEKITAFAAKHGATVTHSPDILLRTIDTPRQTALPRTKRLSNVRGAFAVKNKKVVEGKVCIVVDDVVTTGSTLTEAAAALTNAGASRVILLALSRAG